MKTRKSLISLVLVFAMAFSLNIAPTVANAEGDSDSYSVSIEVRAPYQTYYQSEEDQYSAGFNIVELRKEDLEDSFGIGLPTNGECGYTLVRALAKHIRTWLMDQKNIEFDDEGKAYANELMPNYIKVSYTDAYGYFLDNLSADGENWNTGTTREGTVAGGYWSVIVNGEYSNIGVSEEIPANSPETTVELVWIPLTTNGCGYGHFEMKDKLDDYLISGDKVTYTLNNKRYNDDYAVIDVPVAGVPVQVFSQNKGDFLDQPLTTDENGNITFVAGDPGEYHLVAIDEVTVDGVTISRINRAELHIIVAKKAEKVKKLKAKVTGKKKAKKKNIKVSWTYPDLGWDTAKYHVYLSKKKSSGYKEVSSKNLKKTSFTIKNKKKGTYYIKVRAERIYEIDNHGNYKSSFSAFTTPVKVKVK